MGQVHYGNSETGRHGNAGSGNGLVPKMNQAVSRTNGEVPRRQMVSPGHSVLEFHAFFEPQYMGQLFIP